MGGVGLVSMEVGGKVRHGPDSQAEISPLPGMRFLVFLLLHFYWVLCSLPFALNIRLLVIVDIFLC